VAAGVAAKAAARGATMAGRGEQWVTAEIVLGLFWSGFGCFIPT